MASYSDPKIVGKKRGKKIGERSVQELMGYKNFYFNRTDKVLDVDFKEFMDSDRYGTTFIKSPHILVFKIIFDHPWDVSVN